MELTFQKDNLLHSLQILQGVASGRSTLPILSNVLIQAEDGKITWAPAESQFTVTCQPIYSRDKVEKFNYKSFVNGDGITGGYL